MGVRLAGRTEGGFTFVAAARRRRRRPVFTVACSYVTGCDFDNTILGTFAAVDVEHVEISGLDGY